MRAVHLDGGGLLSGLHAFVEMEWRTFAMRAPVGDGKRNIEIFRQHDVRKIGEGAMNVGFPAEPAFCGHVHPAFQRKFQLQRLLPDFNLTSQWFPLLTTLDGEGVAAGRQFGGPWLGAEGGVILRTERVIKIAFFVAHRRAALAFREEPSAVRIPDVEARGHRRFAIGIENPAADPRRQLHGTCHVRPKGLRFRQIGQR